MEAEWAAQILANMQAHVDEVKTARVGLGLPTDDPTTYQAMAETARRLARGDLGIAPIVITDAEQAQFRRRSEVGSLEPQLIAVLERYPDDLAYVRITSALTPTFEVARAGTANAPIAELRALLPSDAALNVTKVRFTYNDIKKVDRRLSDDYPPFANGSDDTSNVYVAVRNAGVTVYTGGFGGTRDEPKLFVDLGTTLTDQRIRSIVAKSIGMDETTLPLVVERQSPVIMASKPC